ncbi:two-component system, OmpR family, sensor histidine kinase VicK [Rhodocyclaceae bacterium]|nr:two-component system, OmpR family, sensor histidine kinase VicK [Rhodocyclaceae bacterium]
MNESSLKFADLVDIAKLDALMQSFSATLGIANAVIDVDGVVITRSGWQDACTGFHRVNPETCARCIESDTSLVESMTKGAPFAVYRCHNGLVDTAAPIVVDGRHLANVFTGQFLTEPPDLDFFRQQARRFGFDEASYLEAIGRLPVVPREKVEAITHLYAKFAQLLADNGFDRMRQIKATEELEQLNRGLEDVVVDRTAELTRTNEELRDRESLLQEIFDTSSVAIFLVDRRGNITHANRRMAEMFDTSLEALVGSEYIAHVHPDEREVGRQKMLALLASQIPAVDLERLYWREDGSQFWGHLTGRRFHDAKGVDMGLVGVIADVSERREAQRRLQDFNAELEARVRERTAELEHANRDLESFSYSISHDLRAPLRAINGFAQILTSEEGHRLSDDGREMLTRIARAATKLGDLIDDVLEYSRAGRLVQTIEDLDLEPLARRIAGELAAVYPRAEIRIGDLPTVRGDPTMLRQVLENLMGNACKYSAKREKPEIEIGTVTQGEEEVVFVRDNGAGFDMHYAGKLFGMFQRLHTDRDFEGTGVGLAIAKRLIERHGGRIWAEAEPNKGACFYFSLGKTAH